MNETEHKWLADIYENYIKQAHDRGITVLHCDHWSKLVYLRVLTSKHRLVLVNDSHAVCCIDGILVDLQNNAFIKDWGWASSPIPTNYQCKPICSKYPIIHEEIKANYSKPATQSYHLYYDVFFFKKKTPTLTY